MKHAVSRELLAYWNERRGTRRAPERGDIEPGAIRRILSDTFILTLDPERGHPFRLAGTRICALFGRELKGEPFLDFWSAGDRATLAARLAVCGTEANGIVASATGTTAQGWTAELELLALPLRHRGETQGRLIGTFAPLDIPFWIGSSRLEALQLGPFRDLATAGEIEISAPPPAPVGVVVRRRQMFTVYEGDRR